MKKVIVYFYSGTGNTQLIAELYKKYFPDADVTLFRIKMEDGKFIQAPSPEDYDFVGIGFPIYGFNSPEPVYRFVKNLPQNGGQKKPVFIFRTGGEGTKYNGYAAQKIIRILDKKNYDVLTDRLYVMPYNMVFRHSPQMVKSEFLYADAMVRLNVKELAEGLHEKVRFCPLKYWFVPIVRAVWPYARFQGKFIMHADKSKCIKCNSCVKNCPLGNIHFDVKKDRYVWGSDCALCVSCSFNCPKDAVSLGILNPWRINGSYHIEKTAADPKIEFPYFGENLKGLERFLFYDYYRKCDAALQKAGIELK